MKISKAKLLKWEIEYLILRVRFGDHLGNILDQAFFKVRFGDHLLIVLARSY